MNAIPEAAALLAILLCLLVAGVWDMRNARWQAREFTRRHGLR